MFFRLGTIPVKVHGSFLLTMLFFGMAGGRGPAAIAIWVGVVFFSVLIHELGHALVGRAFGLVPAIELHGMGGTTSWPRGKDVGNGGKILISMAGPAVGIIVGIALFLGLSANADFAARFDKVPFGGLIRFLGGESAHAERAGDLTRVAMLELIWVNAGWGVLNLLPMLPLDGGNIMAASLDKMTDGRGERAARMVSIGVSALAALAAIQAGWLFSAVMAGVFGLRNVQALGQASQSAHDEPLRRALEKAVSDINGGYAHAAIEALGPIIQNAKTPQLRAEAMRALAYAYEKAGRWDDVIDLLAGPLGKMLPDEELGTFEDAAARAGRDEHVMKIRALRAGTSASPVGTEFNAGS